MLADLRSAWRLLKKNPILAATAILSLALGIGANSTIFTYANALLLGEPPVAQPHRLVELWTYSRLPGLPFDGYLPWSYPDYRDFTRQARSVSGIAIYTPFTPATWRRNGTNQSLQGQVVSANYFSVLRVHPILGRGFTAAEGVAGSRPVVVIGDALWQRDFGGDPSVLGRTMRLNGHTFTIVGVAPRGFHGVFAGLAAAYFVTTAQAGAMGQAGELTSRGNHSWLAVGRLASGVSAAAAQADLDLIASQLNRRFPKDRLKDSTVRVTALGPVPYAFRQPVSGVMMLLAVIVGLVLLIACANAANLLLVQAQGRRRELAIRGALGAGRRRLARQALTESMVIAVLAGAVGLWFAAWLSPLLLELAPQGGPTAPAPAIGAAVVIFTFVLALITGLITGLAPAIRGGRARLVEALRDGSSGAGHGHSRLRSVLVAGEIAICVVVLAGAGLCLRSLARARRINPGFDAAHLLLAQGVNPQMLGYDGARARAYLRQIAARARQLPGITAVSWINYPPLQGSESDTDLTFPGVAPPPGQDGFDVQYFNVAPNFFAAMGTPLLAGRGFSEQDLARAGKLLVVNQAFAQRFFHGQNPIGKEVDLGSEGKATIVGVTPTGKYRTLGEAPRPVFFRLTDLDQQATLVVHTIGSPLATLAALRSALTELDPNLASDDIVTGDEFMTVPLTLSHVTAVLLAGFAALALILAVVGLYGVVAFSVSQRTREFGVRLALGAQARQLAGLVVGQGVRLAAIGLAVGIVVSLVALRALSAVLYGVSASDPLTFLGVAGLLLAVAALASYWPARRAMRVDPLRALRYE